MASEPDTIIDRIPWPQGTPLDVDPEQYGADWSPRPWARMLLVGGGFVAFASTSFGQRLLAVSPKLQWTAFAIYLASYAFGVFVLRSERVVLPRFWPFRLFHLALSTLVCALYGAGSAHEGSPGHGALLGGAILFVAYHPRSPAVVVSLVVAPLLLRFVAVPGASMLSYGTTLLMSAVASLLFWISSGPAAQMLKLRSAASATRELTEVAQERTATLSVAMSLHDGLSGFLFAARRRLASAQNRGEAQPIASEVLLRAMHVVSTSHRGEIVKFDGIQTALESLAAALGLSAAVHVEHRGAEPACQVTGPRGPGPWRAVHGDRAPEGRGSHEWDDPELGEVLDIATELLANGAKHAPRSPIDLRVRLDDQGLALVCRTDGREAGWPRRGRGLRNVELRALSRGGRLGVERAGDAVDVVVRWPRMAGSGPRKTSSSLRRLLGQTVVIGLAIVPLSLEGSLWGGVLVTAVSCGFAGLTIVHRERRISEQREHLERARAERRAAEGESALRLVESACGSSLAALERAARDGSVTEMRAAVEALSRILADLLWALEWSGDAETLEADLGDFARTQGASPPTSAELADCGTPAARYEARRRLRGPAHAAEQMTA